MRAVPRRLRPPHGPCPRRSPGRRQQGPRPSGLEPAGPCGTPSGRPWRERRKRRWLCGDGRPLRRRAVRRRKPGCPAIPGFRREGAGRSSANTFPARTASLPRVGEPADPGQRGLRKKTAPGFRGQGRRLRGQRLQPGEAAAQAAMTPETSQRREASLALPPVRTGSLGTPPAPRKAPERSSARLASRGNAGAFSRKGGRRMERPGPAGSLPSGRSAFSQRLIGHARPGIRARKLIESPSAAAIVSSWIQLLRRRVVLSLPGHVAVGGHLLCTRRLTHYRSRIADSTKFCGAGRSAHQMSGVTAAAARCSRGRAPRRGGSRRGLPPSLPSGERRSR